MTKKISRHTFVVIVFGIALLLGFGGCSYSHPKDRKPEKIQVTQADSALYGLGTVDVSTMLPQSGFYPLRNALDAFSARMLLMQSATKSIDLQYFIIRDDETGKIIYKMALDAADRGVKVRILLDDLRLIDEDEALAALDMHENITIRIFNPTYFRGGMKDYELTFRSDTVGRRMHIKTFNVDNSAIILGGRNIGNNYFDADPDQVFLDDDILAIGPIASQVTYQFDTYWNSSEVFGLDALTKVSKERLQEIREHLDDFDVNLNDNCYLKLVNKRAFTNDFKKKKIELIFSDVHLHYDMPDKVSKDVSDDAMHLLHSLNPYLRAAKKSLRIISPYFVPTEEQMEIFKELRTRGVEIQVLTNSLPSADMPFAYAFYKHYQKRLLELGIELYETKTNAFKADDYSQEEQKIIGNSLDIQLHVKSIIIDDETLIVGSMNLDPRSFYQNTELIAVVSSPALAKKVKNELFDKLFDMEYSYRLTIEPLAPYKQVGTGMEITGDMEIVWLSEQDGEIIKTYDDAGASFWDVLEVNILYYLPVDNII